MYDQANYNLVRQTIGRLKRCPLCDSVNSRQNRECAVCGWSGKFIHDRAQVAQALDDLIEKCPELEGELLPFSFPQFTLRDKVRRLLARLRRGVDLRA
jgi:hypothetical protein